MENLSAFLLCLVAFGSSDANGIGVLLGVGAFIVVVLVVVLKSLLGDSPHSGDSPQTKIASSDFRAEVAPVGDRREVSDSEFEKNTHAIGDQSDCERYFYTTVAGPSHPNSDGTSRTDIIRRCKVYDGIELRPEPDNPFSPDTMAMHRSSTGEQLGYLKKELSPEIAEDFRKYGPCWLGFFRAHNHHPETGRIVGATIYLMRLPVEKITAEEEAENS